MNKNTFTALIIASLSIVILPAQAVNIDKAAKTTIDTAVLNNVDINTALTNAIAQTPELTESLVAAAIESVCNANIKSNKTCANPTAVEEIIASAISAVGVDSPLVVNILKLGIDAGLDADTVTVLAIANGVDPTVASEATAAGGATGNAGNGNAGNNAGGNGGGGGGISSNQ